MEESYCLSDEASQIVFARVYNLGWAGFPGILSTLQNNESFSLFVKLATLLSLGEKLENEQGLTLFIPDDQVLKKYNDILSKTIGSNIELISTIIKNHIFKGVIIPDFLTALDGTALKAVNGAGYDVNIKIIHDIPMVVLHWKSGESEREAIIRHEGIKCKNGIIYVIDHLLI